MDRGRITSTTLVEVAPATQGLIVDQDVASWLIVCSCPCGCRNRVRVPKATLVPMDPWAYETTTFAEMVFTGPRPWRCGSCGPGTRHK